MKESVKQEIEFSNRELRLLIVPLVIEQLLAIAVGLCDSIMVSYVGEAAISAVSLVDTVNVLLINAFSALATGGAVIVGQYLGRREPQKAGHSGAQLLLFMTEISLVIMAVFYLAKGFVLGAVFWPLSFTLPQALRAAGDTRYTMVGGTVSMWTLRVGLGILMGRYWDLGVLGVWIAMCIDWLLRVTLFVVRFKGHKWETMGIKD